MEVKKITDKYNFYQEGADYVLDLGKIKAGGDRAVEINISGVEDNNLLTLASTCGCTTADKKTLEDGSISAKISYNNCDPTFTKAVTIKYKNVKLGLIKITGTCQ